MGVLAWLILGLIAGLIGSKLVNKAGEVLEPLATKVRDKTAALSFTES